MALSIWICMNFIDRNHPYSLIEIVSLDKTIEWLCNYWNMICTNIQSLSKRVKILKYRCGFSHSSRSYNHHELLFPIDTAIYLSIKRTCYSLNKPMRDGCKRHLFKCIWKNKHIYSSVLEFLYNINYFLVLSVLVVFYSRMSRFELEPAASETAVLTINTTPLYQDVYASYHTDREFSMQE